MNRKTKENSGKQDQDNNIKHGQPIPPKFVSNILQIVKFDRIVINLSDCEYDVLSRVAKQLKFKIKRDPESPQWDVWWTDWHVNSQTLLKMEHHQKINHFPGMFNLSRKNLLAKNLMKMRKKAPDDFNFFPLTWNLPADYNEFRNYYQTKPKGKSRTYIVKPQSMSQGKGIFLTKKIENIPIDQRCVVQRYLSRPYLIDGLKFDLRIYVLVAGVDPLKLFVYNQGLARFATQPYVSPNKDNIDDICMHLTNYAINKQSDKFVFNNDDHDMTKGHKRSLSAIYSHLQSNGVDTKALKNRINQMIVKTIISGLSHLSFQYRSCQRQNYRSDMCFQLLGFDIILSQQLQPLILQINYTPSFSTDTPLDQTIKKNLIKDTLILMQVTKDFKEKTVVQRRAVRNSRMLTGKVNRLSAGERKAKIQQAQRERDEYMEGNLGGFQRVYPLRCQGENDQENLENKKLMEKYEYLIRIEDETLQKRKQKESQQQQKQRVKKQKFQKLPTLSSNTNKTQSSCKQIPSHKKQLSKDLQLSLRKDNSQNLDLRTDCANAREHLSVCTEKLQKKRIFLRENLLNKKKQFVKRETLTLKAIQFEGGKYDGLCQNFKNTYLGTGTRTINRRGRAQ